MDARAGEGMEEGEEGRWGGGGGGACVGLGVGEGGVGRVGVAVVMGNGSWTSG